MGEVLKLENILGPIENVRTRITKCRMYYYINEKYIVRIEPMTYSLQTIFNFKITFESIKINNIRRALLSNFGYEDINKISSFIKYALIYLVNENSEFYKYFKSINKKDVLERIKVINEKIKGDVIDAVIVLIMFTEIKYIFTEIKYILNKKDYIIMNTNWRKKQQPVPENIKLINKKMIEKINIFLSLFRRKVQEIKKKNTYFSLQLEPYKKTDEYTTLKRIDKKMNYKLIKETPEFYKKYIKPFLESKNAPLYMEILYEQIKQFMIYIENNNLNINNLTKDNCKKYTFKIDQNKDLEEKIKDRRLKNEDELNKILDINGEYNEFKMALKNVKNKDKIYLFVSNDRNFVGIPVFYQMASYLCGYNDKNIVYLIFCMENDTILSIRDFKVEHIDMLKDLKKEMIAFLIDRFDLKDDKDLYYLEFGMRHPPIHRIPYFYVNVSPEVKSNPLTRKLFINPFDDIIWFLNYIKQEKEVGKIIQEPTYIYYLEEDKFKNMKKNITDEENKFDDFIGADNIIKSFDNYNKEEKKGIQPRMLQSMTGGNEYSTKIVRCGQYYVVPPISKTDGNVEAIIDINFHNNPFSYEEISKSPLQILFTSGQSSFVAKIKNDKLDKLDKLINFKPTKSIISDAEKQLYINKNKYCPVKDGDIDYRYLEHPIPKFIFNDICNSENKVYDNYYIKLNPEYDIPKNKNNRIKFIWWWKHKFYDKLEKFLCTINQKIYDCYDIILLKQQEKYNLGNRLIKGLEEGTEKYNVLNKKYTEYYNNLIKKIIDEILKNNNSYMIELKDIYTEYYNNLEEILPKLEYFKNKALLNEKKNIASIYDKMIKKVKERKEKIKESYDRINNLKEKKEKEEIDRTQLENDIKLIYTEVLPSFEDLMDKHPHIKPGFRHSIKFLTTKDTQWLIKLVKNIFLYLEKYGFKSINKNLVDLYCQYPNNVIFSCLHGHIIINKDNSYNYEDIPTFSLGRMHNLYTIINMLNLYNNYYLKINMLKIHNCNTLTT
jgi:hypothetical protein